MVFSKIFPKRILVDENGQATNIKLLSFGRPHMRALHLSWISFFIAFTGWFAIPPLMPTIKADINLTPSQISNANMTSVSATILARIIVGPLCDRYGPRRVMAGILLYGALTISMTGLVSSGPGLITIRFFIGMIGATFVPCQYWASKMFSANIIGTANALCAGWGNMGAGVSYFLIPWLYHAFALVAPPHVAWRITLVVPACLCILMAAADIFLGDDVPDAVAAVEKSCWKQQHHSGGGVHSDQGPGNNDVEKLALSQTGAKSDSVQTEDGSYDSPRLDAKMTFSTKAASGDDDPIRVAKPVRADTASATLLPSSSGHGPSAVVETLSLLKCPAVLILMLHYACSFGLELAVDNIIGELFHTHFELSQTMSGMLGSIFGLMNIFSRVCGGILADYANAHIGEGNQGLPFVNLKHRGALYGLVGAGGSVGSIAFNYVFKVYGINYSAAFRVSGYVVLGAAMFTWLLKIQGGKLHQLVSQRLNP
ncbi:High-affinity nitrate transporter 2.1 [Actinomortierella ambigua]|nr:High-affinity nitrate transporter 2.1 [Actinomortierella ambigua]